MNYTKGQTEMWLTTNLSLSDIWYEKYTIWYVCIISLGVWGRGGELERILKNKENYFLSKAMHFVMSHYHYLTLYSTLHPWQMRKDIPHLIHSVQWQTQAHIHIYIVSCRNRMVQRKNSAVLCKGLNGFHVLLQNKSIPSFWWKRPIVANILSFFVFYLKKYF